MSFITNCFEIFGGLAPVIGVLVARMPFLNRRCWFWASEIVFVSISLFLFMYPNQIGGNIPVILALYPLFITVFLFIFDRKYGVEKFSKTLALSLMLGWLITELHEVPGFMLMYFGWLDNYATFQEHFVWFTPLNHAYSIVVAYLAVKLGKLKVKLPVLILVGLGIGLCAIMYPLCPHGVYTVWDVLKRIVWLPILTSVFYFWGDTE